MDQPAPDPRLAHALAWAELSEPIDRQLSPLGLQAIAALAPAPDEVILDIGCGCGQTVVQLAERVGAGGRVIGVDIAPLLLDIARRRTAGLAQARLVEADAQRLDLPGQSVDAIFSRFGVMAIADPAAAFANFRRMLKPGGRLAFVCWRSLGENELDLLPLQVAGLEALADPTPFSFADAGYIRTLLETSGFAQVTIEGRDEMVSSGGVDEMAEVLLRVGALGKILRQTPALRTAAEPRVRAALSERVSNGRVALSAAAWIVTACRRKSHKR
jgi:SAM-dependent methyltransferase